MTVATCVLKKVWGRGFKRIYCNVEVNEYGIVEFTNCGRVVEWVHCYIADYDNLIYAFATKNVMYRKGWFISEYKEIVTESTESTESTVEAPARVEVKKACNYLDNTVVEKQGEWVFVWDCYANRFWAYSEVTNEKKDFICYTDWKEFNPYTEPAEPAETTLQEVAETAVAKLDSVVETKHTAKVDRFYIHNYKNGVTRLYWLNKSALACGFKTIVYRDGVETVVRNERFRGFIEWEQSRENYTKYCKANALKGGE